MQKKTYESIKETKQCFEESFQASDFYDRQIQDSQHLELILNCLDIHDGMKILDLGTGTGYLAFAIAQKHSQIEIVGLDIVEKTLLMNQRKAEIMGLHHLKFKNYDGVKLPFADETFDLIITRYALHHFPVIEDTFQEIKRVLKSNAKFFIADPAPNCNDKERFVDAYMQMKKDGHIQFYTLEEWQIFGKKSDFHFLNNFETYIRFPRKLNTALEFHELLNCFSPDVIAGYHIEISNDEIWITEKVNNVLFEK